MDAGGGCQRRVFGLPTWYTGKAVYRSRHAALELINRSKDGCNRDAMISESLMYLTLSLLNKKYYSISRSKYKKLDKKVNQKVDLIDM